MMLVTRVQSVFSLASANEWKNGATRTAGGVARIADSVMLAVAVIGPLVTCCAAQSVDSVASQLDGAEERKPQGSYCGVYSVFGALAALDIDFKSLLESKYIGSSRGSSIEELKQAVGDHGAHAEILTGLSGETLQHALEPMVLHVAYEGQLKEYNHWVLFLGMEDGKARIVDAPDPMRLIPLAELLAVWDGAALVISDRPLNRRALVAPEHWLILNYVFLAVGVLVLLCLLSTSRWRRPVNEQHRKFGAKLSSPIAQAVVLLLAVACTVVGVHAANQDGFLRNPSVTSFVAASHMDTFFPKMSIGEAYRYMQRDDVIVIDARHSSGYQRGHIPGAINVPIDSSAAQRQQVLADIPCDQPILVYCLSKGCRFDDTVAVLLARDGFKNICLYPGGWREWRESEYHSR